MVRFVVFLFLAGSYANTFALEVYRNSLSTNADHWTFFYDENSKWIIESVSLDRAGWPRLDQRSVFDNEVQARIAVTAAVAGRVRTRQLPPASQVLRGSSGTSLWTVTNEWSWEWELKYADWVKTELDRFWWKNHGLATDCADVAYSARWIFARNNGLPMANRLASGQWFTQESVKPEWAALPTAQDWDKDKRFLAALNYMLDFVFTHTLWNDSYPIAISPASLLPGTHHLSLHSRSGHTQFVYRVGSRADEVPILTLNSTVPRGIRELAEYIFFNVEANPASSAFLRMRWPEMQNGVPSLKDPGTMPYFSAEQFDTNFIRAPRSQFWEEVFFRINPTADFDLIGQKTALQVADLLKARVPIVEDGYKVCGAKHCLPGSADWEAWSTPSRDDRIRATIFTLQNLYRHIQDWDPINTIMKLPVLTQGAYTFDVGQLMTAFGADMPSSDPNDDPQVRWGVHPAAVGAKVLKEISQGLRDREAKIAGPRTCLDGSCIFGSKAFLEDSTYNIDSRISRSGWITYEYCRLFGQVPCDEVSQILKAQTVTANGQTLNLWDWISAAVRFNSDPRQPEARRYAGFSNEFPHLISALTSDPSMRRHGNTVSDGYRFYNIRGADLIPWALAPGETLLDLDTRDGWAWSVRGNNLSARLSEFDPPLNYALVSEPYVAMAYGAYLLVTARDGAVLLKAENARITEVAQWAGASALQRRDNGFAVFTAQSGQMLLMDMENGALIRLPAGLSGIHELKRSGTDYLLKFSSSAEPRILCRLMAADSSYVDLTSTGNCVNYATADQTGLFEINNRAVKRVFDQGRIVSEEDVGGLSEYYSDRLLKTVDNGQYRYFCFGTETLRELTKPSGILDLASCNDRFVIEAVTLGDWRARDRITGAVALRTYGYMDFASSLGAEHYVIAGDLSSGNEPFAGLLDLERPERFSILTDKQIWPDYANYDRPSGLMVMKDGREIWLGD